MDCDRVLFSGHALRRLFERGLGKGAILDVIEQGEVIGEYLDDRPYPSYLLLSRVDSQPIHVVLARDSDTGTCYVVTAYRPDPELWSADFSKRRR